MSALTNGLNPLMCIQLDGALRCYKSTRGQEMLRKDGLRFLKKALFAIYAYIMSGNEHELSNSKLFTKFKKDIIDFMNEEENMVDEEIKDVVLPFINE